MRSMKTLLATIEDIDSFTIQEIRFLIDKAAHFYYRANCRNAIMTDERYDALIGKLRELWPSDERLIRIGVLYNADELRNKTPHPIPMGSLDNTDDGILGYEKWYHTTINKLNSSDLVSVCASLKIDGSSIRLKYKAGKLVEAATRGNGEVGENITANVANFQGVPICLSEDVDLDVRGEAILYVDDYKAIRSSEAGMPFDEIQEKDRSNPRNIGNGIIGRDDGTDSDKLHFIAFNVEGDFASEDEKFKFLQNLGFKTVPYRICPTTDDVINFYNHVADNRDSLPFEIDGVVVVINEIRHQKVFITNDIKTRLRPKYARAIKFPHKSNKTILRDVILSVGHTRAIIPTAVLDETRIGGVNVTSALLNNWDEIDRLNVAIGDEVEVVLAGDIIPKIIRVVKRNDDRKPIPAPERCPACNSHTTRNHRGKDGAVLYCTNNDCPEAMLQKVDHWIGSSKKGVGILGIGDTILRTLWNNGIVKSPADLYTMTVDQIKDLEMNSGIRIGEPRAVEIVNNIADKRYLSLPVFLGSLGIELLGRRRVELLKDAAGGQLDTIHDWLDTDKLSTIKIDGFGDTIRAAVVDGINENKALIAKFIECGVTIDAQNVISETSNDSSDSAGVMSGVSFCFTGTRDCVEEVQRLGATITSGVAKSKPSPDFLVQKDPLSNSNKTKNAEANGHTKIISLDFLKRVLAGKASLDGVQSSISSIDKPVDIIDTEALVADIVD